MLRAFLGRITLSTAARILATLFVVISIGSPQPSQATTLDVPVIVRIADSSLDPKEVTIAAGVTVTWTNQGTLRQRLSAVSRHEESSRHSGGHSGKLDWDSGHLKPGQSFSMRFSDPGTYQYVSKNDKSSLPGTVVVLAVPAATPSPVPVTPSPVPVPATPTQPPPPAPPPVSSPPPAPSGSALTIGDEFFAPASLTVPAGTTVTWSNKGKAPHTVTSDAGLWDSGTLKPGQTYSFAFQGPGTYPYNCIFHGGMVGKIIVSGGAPAQSPAPPTATPAPKATPAPSNPAPSPSATATPLVQPGPLTATPAPPPAGAGISLGDDFFSPTSLAVIAGTTVTWTNNGKKPHTVTSDAGLWDSGMVKPGQAYSFAFQAPGIYTYNCIFHAGMVGKVTVSETASAPNTLPPAAPSPNPASPSQPTLSPTATQTPIPTPTTAPAPAPQPGPTGATVSVGDNTFSPTTLSVAAGTSVVWTNSGRRPHTVTSDAGLWDSGMLSSGQAYSFTFQAPGTFSYTCLYHAGMAGTVVVTGSGQTPVTPVTPSPEPVATASPTPTPATRPTVTPAPQPGGNAISMGENTFSPPSLAVIAGTTVTWSNNGQKPHTATSDTGAWDSGLLTSGQSYSHTFDDPGTYSYNCLFHDGMAGTVIVMAGSSGPTATPTPVATPAPAVTPAATPAVISLTLPLDLAGARTGAVSMGDSSFSAASITVAPGGSVTWTNNSRLPHTVTISSGLWDSGMIMPGRSYSHTFQDAGRYDYTCILHEGMVGTVLVEGDAAPASDVLVSEEGDAAPTFRVVESEEGGASRPGDSTEADLPPGDPTALPASLAARPSRPALMVSMRDNSFSPEAIMAPAGTTITWNNDGRAPHTVTSMDSLWDSGLLTASQNFSYVFDQPGTYRYLCVFHPGMEGTITVRSAAAGDAQVGGQPIAAGTGTEPPASQEPSPRAGEAAPAAVSRPETNEASMTALAPDQRQPAVQSPGGDQPAPTVVIVHSPSFSTFEIVVLASALASIAVSTTNVFLVLRTRRKNESMFDW